MATTAEACISTVRANLHEVFEEADPQKRRQAIERLWSTSEECIFIDPDAVWRGHDRIDQCVSALVKKFAGWVFVETGTAQVLPEGDGEYGVRVVKQEWGYGPPGEVKVTGTDVATLDAEVKVKVLYAILSPA